MGFGISFQRSAMMEENWQQKKFPKEQVFPQTVYMLIVKLRHNVSCFLGSRNKILMIGHFQPFGSSLI